MTSLTPLAEGRHNHPPRCCCCPTIPDTDNPAPGHWKPNPANPCPGCPEHGGLAEPVCDCYPGGFSPETYEGPQHHCRVHGHGPDCCPSCHTTGGHPHTEYCKLPDDPWHMPLAGNIEVRNPERPDDDPAPTPTCDGRNCGGHPHA